MRRHVILSLLLVVGVAAALRADDHGPGDPQPPRACENSTGIACRTLTINCGSTPNNCLYCDGQGRHAGCTGQENQSCEIGLEANSCGKQWTAACDPATGGCGAFSWSEALCPKGVCL